MTQLNIGLNVYGQMNILIPRGTKLPYSETFDVSTTSAYKSLELYIGLYNNNTYNILLCDLTIAKMTQLHISLTSEHMIVSSCDFLSEPIIFDKTIHKQHTFEYKARSEEWILFEESRMKYMDYIYETKEALYDPYVIKKIPPDIYKSVIHQFKQAEQICFVKDISLNELLTIHREVEDMVNKVLNDVVIENNGEFK